MSELLKLEEELIEHKFPTEPNLLPAWFIEAAGDIFRELCKKYPDIGYIMQKLDRLKRFGDFSLGDFCELEEFRMNCDLNAVGEFKSNLEKLKEELGKRADELGWKYEPMKEALEIIEVIVSWAIGEITTCEARFKILGLIKEIEREVLMK